jgi:uncharacterized protein (TIGR01777 family)
MARNGDHRENNFYWKPSENIIHFDEDQKIDVVINLSGEPLTALRWTKTKKKRIVDSRIHTTTLLSEKLAALNTKPSLFISASAVGYYGNRGNNIVDENDENGTGFLARLCKKWEKATLPATVSGIRTVNLRLGIILTPTGGMLKQLLTPFKLGLGGKLGNGQQYLSWISLEEIGPMVEFLINHKNISGPVNAVSPTPVTNTEFTKQLSYALKRPAIFHHPKFLLKIIFAELANELLLASTRAIPEKLQQAGYSFEKPDIKDIFKTLSKRTDHHDEP